MRECKIELTTVMIGNGQDPMTSTVSRIQLNPCQRSLQGSIFNGIRSIAIAVFDEKCPGEISVSKCEVRIETNCAFEQYPSTLIVIRNIRWPQDLNSSE